MKKQKYSIEFSHIYADEVFEDKQLGSVAFLHDLIEVWEFDYSTIILIDDYNPNEHTLDTDELLSKLTGLGIKPDFWAYEKDMAQYADSLFKSIAVPRVLSRYKRYYASKKQYPCSFLTAIWYSIRLGVFDPHKVIHSTTKRQFKPADRLLNILVEDFKGVEHETLALLRATSHSHISDLVQNLYYETPVRMGKDKKLITAKVF